jgi:hypothetical protein
MHLVALLLQTQPDAQQIQRMLVAMATLIPLLIVIGIAIVMVPCWFILKKAGFSPWLSLLCVIPSLGTLVLLYILAFADWKILPPPQATWTPQPPYPPQPPLPPRA